MADKYRQIQKFVEILSGLVDRSKVINKKIQDNVDENLSQSSIGQSKKSEINNIKVTDKLFRKPTLRMVDMGSGMAYLTFSAHSHLSQKFDLGKFLNDLEKDTLFSICDDTMFLLDIDTPIYFLRE